MEVLKLVSKSPQETKEIGKFLGQNLRRQKVFLERAFVVALRGNLGGGKTTFVQGLAEGLGVKEKIKSPSFAVLKIFDLPAVALAKAGLKPHKKEKFSRLLHFDFYRLEKLSKKELGFLGFQEFIKQPENLIVVEWSEKIKKFLPKKYLKIEFIILNKNKRELKFVII